MFDFLPYWFQIFFFSMIPWLESRYVIPYAMLNFDWSWWEVLPFAILGNMLPIPFILLFFHYVEKWLRNYRFWTKSMDRLFSKTRIRADKKVRRYEHMA
ncbi:MAG: small multi-drug export protein, partial [Elusimicrobiota bacterium]